MIDLRNDINKNWKWKSEKSSQNSWKNPRQWKGKAIKILTRKEMIQRLPVALAQVKAGNTSENLLNEIRQIIYSLYREKEVTKKCITI